MGLIVTAYMLSLGSEYFTAVLVGNIGAIIGGIASVRVMLRIAKSIIMRTNITASKLVEKYHGDQKDSEWWPI